MTRPRKRDNGMRRQDEVSAELKRWAKGDTQSDVFVGINHDCDRATLATLPTCTDDERALLDALGKAGGVEGARMQLWRARLTTEPKLADALGEAQRALRSFAAAKAWHEAASAALRKMAAEFPRAWLDQRMLEEPVAAVVTTMDHAAGIVEIQAAPPVVLAPGQLDNPDIPPERRNYQGSMPEMPTSVLVRHDDPLTGKLKGTLITAAPVAGSAPDPATNDPAEIEKRKRMGMGG